MLDQGGSAGPTYTQLGSSGATGRSGQPGSVAGYHQNTGTILKMMQWWMECLIDWLDECL